MAEVRAVYVKIWLDGVELTDAEERVLTLEVEERADGVSTAAVSMEMAPNIDDEGIVEDWDALADGRWALLHRLSVGFGLGEQQTDEDDEDFALVFDGYITAVEPHFGEQRSRDSTLEVTAMDPLCLLDFEERHEQWEQGLTDAEMVEQIFGQYGFSTEVDATAPARQLDRAIMVQRCTDAEFIRMLARRNGYEAYVAPSSNGVSGGEAVGSGAVGHFHLSRVGDVAREPLTLMPEDTGSLKEFTARWEAHRPTRVHAQHIDERTRIRHEHDQTEARFGESGGGSSRADILAERFAEVLTRRSDQEAVGFQSASVPHEVNDLRDMAWARFAEADCLVSGTGVVEGQRHPEILRARRSVELRGAGTLLDGAWYVRGTRHRWTWDAAEKTYEVDVELSRSVLNGVG